MGFDNIKGKKLVDITSKSFAQAVNEVDPSEDISWWIVKKKTIV